MAGELAVFLPLLVASNGCAFKASLAYTACPHSSLARFPKVSTAAIPFFTCYLLSSSFQEVIIGHIPALTLLSSAISWLLAYIVFCWPVILAAPWGGKPGLAPAVQPV